MQKNKNQAYRIVDIHGFEQTDNPTANILEERLFVYLPLMAGEPHIDDGYTPKHPIQKHKCRELNMSRSVFCDLFLEILRQKTSSLKSPEEKMKRLICSAGIKAAEMSLWTTYSQLHLTEPERKQRAETMKLDRKHLIQTLGDEDILKNNNLQFINNILDKEENEIPQDFRLIQMRMIWTDKGKRRSLWSKVNPLPQEDWFSAFDDIDYVRNVKKCIPKYVPQLCIDSSDLSEVAAERIERNISMWRDVLYDRYEIARIVGMSRDLSEEETLNLFYTDKFVRCLDMLVKFETRIVKKPSSKQGLHKMHERLVIMFSRYKPDEKDYFWHHDDAEDQYGYDFIKSVPVHYGLAHQSGVKD